MAIKDWLKFNVEIIDIPLTCTNILQFRPDAKRELLAIFDSYLDKRTKSMLTMSVFPNATSILNAARANTLSQKRNEDKLTNECQDKDSPAVCNEDKLTNECQDKDSPAVCNGATNVQPKNKRYFMRSRSGNASKESNHGNDSRNSSYQSPIHNEGSKGNSASSSCQNAVLSSGFDENNTSTTPSQSLVPRNVGRHRKYMNSRLWTMTSSSPGSSNDVTELYDEYFATTSRMAKRRKTSRLPSDNTGKIRELKICLLGGCNSTMTTVRTIFRHIQPFNVVTGKIVNCCKMHFSRY